MFETTVSALQALPEAVARFIDVFSPFSDRVFAFHAPMGAGKTTFISELTRQLGGLDEANSPTFSIVNEYDTERWGRVYHLDCYRIEDEEEAFEAGVEDYFSSGSPCFVEWPEKIPGLIPDDAVTVEISIAADNSRIIKAYPPSK